MGGRARPLTRKTRTRRAFVAATTLAHRLDPPAEALPPIPGSPKDARDLELPPWNKGRYGTAIGRAVHGTLQTIDLASGAGIETAAAQAAAEGVLGQEDTIAALTRAAVASPIVTRAAARSHWRETYVAVPLDGITLEGYVDLVFRDDDGLVVVDYKTDAVDAETRAERITHYRIQAAAYAIAVGEATGESVVRCVLCLLDPDGARDVVVEGEDLGAGMAEVRRLAGTRRIDPSRSPPRAHPLTADRTPAEPEAPIPVCHPGCTREGPQVLPQVLGDGRRRRWRARGFPRAARPGGGAARPRDDPDRRPRGHDQRARRAIDPV